MALKRQIIKQKQAFSNYLSTPVISLILSYIPLKLADYDNTPLAVNKQWLTASRTAQTVEYDNDLWKEQSNHEWRSSVSSFSLAFRKHPHAAHFINFPASEVKLLLANYVSHIPLIQSLVLQVDLFDWSGVQQLLNILVSFTITHKSSRFRLLSLTNPYDVSFFARKAKETSELVNESLLLGDDISPHPLPFRLTMIHITNDEKTRSEFTAVLCKKQPIPHGYTFEYQCSSCNQTFQVCCHGVDQCLWQREEEDDDDDDDGDNDDNGGDGCGESIICQDCRRYCGNRDDCDNYACKHCMQKYSCAGGCRRNMCGQYAFHLLVALANQTQRSL